MYHFAKCLGAPSAEYASIVRRFIQKVVKSNLLLFICDIGTCISCSTCVAIPQSTVYFYYAVGFAGA